MRIVLNARPFLVLLPLLAATPAAAQDGPVLAGVWGNEAGCAFERGGTRDNEDMLLLTPEKFETYAMLCEFLQVLATDGAAVATALCGHEGEETLTAGMVVIRAPLGSERAERIVADADGNEWARLAPCR